MVHLYDARKHDGGPFSELKVEQPNLESFLTQRGVSSGDAKELSRSEWKSITFNAAGSQMLATARGGLAILLDGFTADIMQAFLADAGGSGTSNIGGDDDERGVEDSITACFTRDDRFVLGGCSDGTVKCWSAASGSLVNTLTGHVGPVSAIACNPRRAQVASSCTNTALWI